MHQRILYGLIAGTTVVSVVLGDALIAELFRDNAVIGPIVARGTLIPAFIVALCAAATRELIRMIRAAGVEPHTRIAGVMTLLCVVSPWLCATGLVSISLADVDGLRLQMILLVVLAIWTAMAQIRRGVQEAALADIGATWLIVLYLGFLASFVMRLRCDAIAESKDAALLFLLFLLLTKVTDIGGYFVGTTFGKHRLAPSASPAKSYEGALGGMAASVSVAVLLKVLDFAPLVDWLAPEQFQEFPYLHPLQELSVWQMVVLGASLSFFGQLGDLFESVLKRSAGIKDSASLLPTYGGTLDLMDSPLMAGPVAWFLLTVWWAVI